jgi:hypothetical protein
MEAAQSRHLAALEGLSNQVSELRSALIRVELQVNKLNTSWSKLERGLDVTTLPFQSAVFDYHEKEKSTQLSKLVKHDP